MDCTSDAPPRPPWRTVDGDFVDGDEIRGDDIEIDLTGDVPVVRRKQLPMIHHPWARNWPTWPEL